MGRLSTSFQIVPLTNVRILVSRAEWDPVFLTLLTALDDGVPPRTVTTTGMAVVSIPGAKATKKRKCPDAAAAGDSSPQMITSS